MTEADIKEIQARIGATPDGHWGPKSIAAAKTWLKRLNAYNRQWPSTDQASLTAFYGKAGDESKLVTFAAPKGIKYEGRQCSVIRCHARVAESLERIMVRLVAEFPEIAADYAGCFNNRAMRGGSTPSLHARGAAVDFAPDTNGNHTHWPAAADMPWGVMEIFASEGWMPAGVFWSRDAMHFQATA